MTLPIALVSVYIRVYCVRIICRSSFIVHRSLGLLAEVFFFVRLRPFSKRQFSVGLSQKAEAEAEAERLAVHFLRTALYVSPLPTPLPTYIVHMATRTYGLSRARKSRNFWEISASAFGPKSRKPNFGLQAYRSSVHPRSYLPLVAHLSLSPTQLKYILSTTQDGYIQHFKEAFLRRDLSEIKSSFLSTKVILSSLYLNRNTSCNLGNSSTDLLTNFLTL